MVEEGKEIKCCVCGSREVLAKIGGKYYCAKCGRKVVMEHLLAQIKVLEKSVLKQGATKEG